MIKKLLASFIVISVFSACHNEPPSTENAVQVGENEWKKVETDKPIDELAANSVPDSSSFLKIKQALATLQTEYQNAENKVPNTGKVTVLVDENLTLVIKNENGGKVYETRANLKSLDPETSHLEIIPNKVPGEFPGVKVPVLAGQSKVFILENGAVKKEQDYLEIILADRPSVQRALPALLLALHAAHGRI